MEVRFPVYFKFTTILFGLILLVYVLMEAQNILILLALAGLISLLLLPLVRKLERKMSSSLAILIGLVLIILVLSLVSIFVYSQLVDLMESLPDITQRLTKILERGNPFFEKYLGVERGQTISYLKEELIKLLHQSTAIFSTTLSVTTGIFTAVGLVPVFIFFMLYYRSFFKEFLLLLFKAESHTDVLKTIEKIERVAQSYLSGLLIVISIISILNVIGLYIVGVKYAIFFGVFAGMLNIIPYIGVFLGSTLPIVYTALKGGSLIQCIGAGAALWVVQLLESNFITPNIVGGKVSLNPFASILALLIGGAIWGPLGMILFVPFTAILKVIFDAIDPLKPYGFILGEPPTAKEDDKEPFFKRVWPFKKKK